MSVDVGVDGLEVGLIDHAELVLGAFLRVGGVGGCDDDVEGALQDGGEGDAFDGVEGEECDGFFEAEDDACGKEVEVAWDMLVWGGGEFGVWLDWTGHTFFAAFERLGVESLLALAMALWDLACEFSFVWEDCFLAERGHECVKLSSCHVDKRVLFASG